GGGGRGGGGGGGGGGAHPGGGNRAGRGGGGEPPRRSRARARVAVPVTPAPGPIGAGGGHAQRRLTTAGVAALVALVSLLPFARGLGQGQSFYFRDLARYFLPIRMFQVEGLLQGELRHWNPYVYEGEPVPMPPVGYPIDLLQALVPDEHGISLVLALHVALAAGAFFALARGLGLSLAGAAAGGFIYGLGGFSLSSLNLYIQLEALAWAPLV